MKKNPGRKDRRKLQNFTSFTCSPTGTSMARGRSLNPELVDKAKLVKFVGKSAKHKAKVEKAGNK